MDGAFPPNQLSKKCCLNQLAVVRNVRSGLILERRPRAVAHIWAMFTSLLVLPRLPDFFDDFGADESTLDFGVRQGKRWLAYGDYLSGRKRISTRLSSAAAMRLSMASEWPS
jgi:hypothetical protein